MKAALRTSVSEEETRHHKHSINPLARAELQNIQSLDNDNDNDNDNDSLPLQRAKSASVVMRMETVAAAVEDMSRRLQELKRLQSLLVHPHGRFMVSDPRAQQHLQIHTISSLVLYLTATSNIGTS